MHIECICQNPDCRRVFFRNPSRIKDPLRVFCKRTCIRHAPSLSERFWKNVAVCEHGTECPYCCWEWLAGRRPEGYGLFNVCINGKWKSDRAHRIAWQLWNKRLIPKGLFGCHYCSHPPCCNPFHIRPGTAKDNSQDAVKRGSLIGRYHGVQARGEQLPQSKLKDSDIPLIRKMYVDGWKIKPIAEHFGVDKVAIYNVVHGKTWTHIPSTISNIDILMQTHANKMRGITHHNAKLTESQVTSMRLLYDQGARLCDLGRQFSITPEHAGLVVRRRIWKHVP